MKNIFGLALILSLMVSNLVSAGQSEALTWLSSQQGDNGAIYLDSDIANIDQSTHEAAQALADSDDSSLSANVLQASAFLNERDVATLSTELLSRRILLKASANISLDQDVQELLSRRSSRGGYGDYISFAPNTLSTAFALNALNAVGVPADGQTIQYLIAQQQSDGSWLFPELGDSSVELTAYAMNALWRYRNSVNVSSSLDNAQSFLESQQNSLTGLWNSTEASALSLIALFERNVDRSAYLESLNTLISQQLDNGSYEGDVYLTGLITRLILISEAAAEDAAVISGQVLDGESGFPLSNVRVELTGASNLQVSTNSEGQFTVIVAEQGLYEVRFVLDGYGDTMLQTTLQSGDQRILNDVVLSRITTDPDTGEPSTTGTIRGLITATINGAPLSGVNVSVNDQSELAAVTNALGNYVITNVPAGPVSVTASLSGYETQVAAADIQANQTLIFSPQLSVTAQSAVTIFGVIRDSVSTEPLAGVTVNVVQGNISLSAVTDASGVYRIVDIPSGEIEFSASFTGYQTVAGSSEVPEGANLEFSPSLTLEGSTPDVTTGALRAQVVDSLTGRAISAANISISNVETSQVEVFSTNEDGVFNATNLIAGQTLVTITSSAHETQTITLEIQESVTLDLTVIQLVPLDQNVQSNVTGVVVNATTGEPLSDVSIQFAASTTQSDGDGRFLAENLDEGEVSFTFDKVGFQSVRLSLVVRAGESIDLAQIRMRAEDVTQLLPDLSVISIDDSALITDLQSLAVSGDLQLELTNSGNQGVDSSVNLVAFSDQNKNGEYDLSIDPILGETIYSNGLIPNESTRVSIAIAGVVDFRDAPIHVVVDSSNLVIESDETNNTRSSASTCSLRSECQSTGGSENFELVSKWQWLGGEVVSTPMVAQANDDNNDGEINHLDTPDVFINNRGTLRVLDGTTGIELYSNTNIALGRFANLALGDIDGDGLIEIVAPTLNAGLVAFNHDASVLWQSPGVVSKTIGGASIADIDADGIPEIVYERSVINADGTLRWRGEGTFVGRNQLARIDDTYGLVADIDDASPGQEIVFGASAYAAGGELLWQNDIAGEGFTGIGDFNGDGNPEIVKVFAGRVSLLDAQGNLIWGPIAIPGMVFGGAPTIGDMDGDGEPEIGVGGSSQYTVLEGDGSILWQAPIQDFSSAATGSSVFDFNNDGKAEVVFIDEVKLRVYDGSSGDVILEQENLSLTAFEYPVVVDIDNDGHAEIIVPGSTGIQVLEDFNDSWVGTRSIWNQHAYSIDNVNDDGSIPPNPEKSWLTHNTFRLNAFPQCFDEPAETPEQRVYLNDQNISVSLGAGMAPEPFVNRSTADTLASVIDAESASASELNTDDTHIRFRSRRGGVSLRFDFRNEYDLRVLHFWNYYAENLDVDDIDLRFFNAENEFVGQILNIQPSLGGQNDNPIFAENIEAFFPSNVQYVDVDLAGSNGEINFSNIGFTGILSDALSPVSSAIPDISIRDGYSIEVFAAGVTDQQGPNQLAFNSGGDLFLALGDTGIAKIPAGTNTAEVFGDTQVIDTDGVVVDSQDNIIVSGFPITKYAPDGSVLWEVNCPAGNLQLLTVDAEDNVYVGSLGTSLCKISANGEMLETLGGFSQPSEPVVGLDGLLYVGQLRPQNIAVVSLENSMIVDTLDVGFFATQPVFDGSGNLHVGKGISISGISTDAGIVDIQSRTVTTIATGFGNVRARAIGPDGNLYIADATRNTIYKITLPENETESEENVDLTVSKVERLESENAVSARFGNGGSNESPAGITASIYRTLLGTNERVLIGQLALPALASGEFVDLKFNNLPVLNNGDTIEVVVDSNNDLDECDESNNSMRIDVAEELLVDATIALTLDKDTVSSNEAVQISSLATNTGTIAANFVVRTSIEDLQGNVVINFPDSNLVQLDQGLAESVENTWNTQSTLSGTYVVKTGIYTLDEKLIDESLTNIEVVANLDQRISLRTATDRFEYHVNDSVQIDNLVRNLSVNSIERGASQAVVVNGPNDQEVFSASATIEDMTPNYSNSFIDLLSLSGAPVGQYTIVGTVISSTGVVLATDNAVFNVVNNIGLSISGFVSVSAPEIAIGEELVCADTLVNSANLTADNLAVRQLVINVDTAELVSTQESALSLNANQEFALQPRDIETTGLNAGNYSCALQVFVNNEWLNLDNAFFEIVEPPINIELSASIGDKGRVLILLDDSSQCTDEPFGPRTAPNLIEQRAFLENLLDQAAWSYTITQNVSDFTRELRTGGYSNYLLMSELSGLPHFVQKEVREAVFRGEGLIEAGKRLQPHEVLQAAHGISHRGQQRQTTGLSLVDSELSNADNLAFSHRDSNLRISSRGATVVGEYLNGQADQSTHHQGRHFHGYRFFRHHHPYWCPPIQRTSPAITVNDFGLGRTVFMGFDVLLEALSMGSQESVYTELLLNALVAVNPEPPLTTVGTDYPLVFTVRNIGVSTPATLVLPVPDSVSVVDVGEGVIDEATQSITWSLNLNEGEVIEIPLWVEMPESEVSLTGSVVTGEQASSVEQASADITLVPETAINLDEIIESTKQARALRKVKQSLVYARWYLQRGRTDHVLRSLLIATSHVASIQQRYESENLSALRINIDLVIKQIAQQTVVREPRQRCLVRGSWRGYHRPQTPRRCGHRPRTHQGGYYNYKQLHNDLGSEQ